MKYLNKVIYTLLLGLFLTSISYSQESVSSLSNLNLISPHNNFITTKNKVLFKGTLEKGESIYLNNEKLSLSDDGRFFHRATLTTVDAYNHFELRSVLQDGTENFLKLKIFYKSTEPNNISSLSSSTQKPLINLISPQNDSISNTKKILFKGQVYGAEQLLINDIPIDFTSNGEFYHRVQIDENKDHTLYTLEAIADDKETKTKLLRRIYFQNDNADTPSLIVYSPNDKYVSDTNKISVSGELKNADYVLVNKKKISPNKKGKFSTTISLKNENDYNSISLIAVNKKNKTEIVRSVYYQTPAQAELQEKSIADVPKELVQNRIPSIVIQSPQDNFVTYKNHVVIKGNAKHANELYINNRFVKFDDKGNFSEAFELNTIGKYVFNVFALGNGNLNKTNLIKLFRVDDNKSFQSEKIMPKSTSLSEKLEKKISIDLAGANIRDVLSILADKGNLNIVTDESLIGDVYVSLSEVSLIDAIDFILGSQGFSYKISNNTILVGNRTFLDQPRSIETKVIRLNNANPSLLIPILSKYLSDEETIQFQDNLLIINADRNNLEKISALVSKLDEEKVPQIILEAQILEVSKSALDNIGVNWADTYGIGLQNTMTNGTNTYTAGISLQSVISLLESKGQAQVLAKPRIKAIHGETATIFIGDQIPYTQLTVGTTGAISESVSFVNSGINLSVFPEINVYTQEIKIKIQPEVSYVNGYRGANNDVPIVRTRKVDTTVFVQNGNTVLIGGLFNSSDSDNIARFPFLGSIPLVGRLFTSSKVEQDQTELVIAITPQIISDDFKESIPLPLLK